MVLGVPSAVIAETVSDVFTEVAALTLERTAVAPVSVLVAPDKVMVGCVIETPVIQFEVVGFPRAVIAEAEDPIVTPVTIESPSPSVAVAPVATVTAVPTLATFLSDIVTAVTISEPAPLLATLPVAAVSCT